MSLALLIDFGSTFTKVAAVDLAKETVMATAMAPTTVETGLIDGLQAALADLTRDMGQKVEFELKLAASSAAGGLKMVAIGLVSDLTAEAAKRAALGAGARVMGVFSYELTPNDLDRIHTIQPDIILLAGGTDGGNKDVIVYNARQLSTLPRKVPIVVAGNRVAAPEVCEILQKAGHEVVIADNVMPTIGELQVDSARQAIRQVFLERIVEAKGLKSVEWLIDGVLMPTPAAVLEAGILLAKGTKREPGMGELIIIDVGGATTDVHSIAKGFPRRSGVTVRGLPEPFAKRTVEGDLGMRSSAPALLQAVGAERLAALSGFPEEEVAQRIARLAEDAATLPASESDARFDAALGRAAVEEAMWRHAGSYEVTYTPVGSITVQEGKDLTGVETVIGTGGVIVNGLYPGEILCGAAYTAYKPQLLCPMKPKYYVDSEYLLAAMGLLAEREPDIALRLLKKNLRLIEDREGN